MVFGWVFAGHQIGAAKRGTFGAGFSRTEFATYLPAFFIAGALCPLRGDADPDGAQNRPPRASAAPRRRRHGPERATATAASAPQPYGVSGIRHGVKQRIHDAVEFVPRRLAVALIAHDDELPALEALVEHVAAGEFRADQVPDELVKLVARGSRHGRGAPTSGSKRP